MKRLPLFAWLILVLVSGFAANSMQAAESAPTSGRFLYVATPGIRNYLEYGGHGVLVYDIDHDHRLVRRIASGGLDAKGKASNVKGICASAATGRLYVSTIESLQCYDLLTDQIVWEKKYEGGCDRMSITPDGKTLYVPSFEKDHWNVVDAIDGHVVAKITPNSRAHNTIVGPNGKEAYLAGLGAQVLTVADTATQQITRTVGPFGSAIRPFTVDGRQTRIYANVNRILERPGETSRLSESRHRAFLGRERIVARRCAQQPAAHFRPDGFNSAADRNGGSPRPTGLDHGQHRWRACVLIDWRRR
jgi:hypothetical protein